MVYLIILIVVAVVCWPIVALIGTTLFVTFGTVGKLIVIIPLVAGLLAGGLNAYVEHYNAKQRSRVRK